MPETITPNYALIKPEIGGSNDVWGNRINANLDILDSQIKATDVSAKNSLQKSGPVADRTAADYLFLDPALTAYSQGPGALMTNKDVRYLCNLLLPVGTILMWSGTIANIPYGWALCNGQTAGGYPTPNLADRFIMSASAGNFTPHYTGGNSVLNYSDYTGYYTLSVNEMPQHYHPVSDPSHYHPVSDPTHAHTSYAGGSSTQGFGDTGGRVAAYSSTLTSYHATGLTVNYAYTGISTAYQGASWGHRHPMAFSIPWNVYWPQFYALAFIMRYIAF